MQKIKINKKISIFSIQDRDLFTTLSLRASDEDMSWRRAGVTGVWRGTDFSCLNACHWIHTFSIQFEKHTQSHTGFFVIPKPYPWVMTLSLVFRISITIHSCHFWGAPRCIWQPRAINSPLHFQPSKLSPIWPHVGCLEQFSLVAFFPPAFCAAYNNNDNALCSTLYKGSYIVQIGQVIKEWSIGRLFTGFVWIKCACTITQFQFPNAVITHSRNLLESSSL